MITPKCSISYLGCFTLVLSIPLIAPVARGQSQLYFDGKDAYVQIADSPDLSVAPGGMTVSVWMKPSTLTFPQTEGTDACQKYVHWLGKGEGSTVGSQQEWVFRMYSLNPDCPTANPAERNPRQNRISFYVYNLERPPDGRPNLGVGSYFQESVQVGDWIHVVGVAYYDDTDERNNLTAIYKNAVLKHCDNYRGIQGVQLEGRTCNITYWPGTTDPIVITPEHGNAPLRLGTREGLSYWLGGLARVRLWNRPLGVDEISSLMRAERCLFDPSTVCDGTVPAGVAAEWLLSEEAGTTAYDGVGGHDGTIVGSYRPVR